MFGLHFSTVLAETPALVGGLVLTIELSVLAIALGSFVGLVSAALRSIGPPIVEWIVRSYVEIIRNTPFLVQLFILYFSLPSIGIRLDANVAALFGMALNFAGYATEILRSGIEAVPTGQVEAGHSFGFTRLQVYRYIILFPALKTVYPALASQFVLLMLATSVVSQISAPDLFHTASIVQSRTFRDFEVYIVAAGMYLAMALIFRLAFALIHRWVFQR